MVVLLKMTKAVVWPISIIETDRCGRNTWIGFCFEDLKLLLKKVALLLKF